LISLIMIHTGELSKEKFWLYIQLLQPTVHLVAC